MEKKTPNLNLNLINPFQTQKEVDINEALMSFDCLINKIVKSRQINNPPQDVNDGDVYIVPEGSTGSWKNYTNKIAIYYNGWRFFRLKVGFLAWIEDQSQLQLYIGEDGWKLLFSEDN